MLDITAALRSLTSPAAQSEDARFMRLALYVADGIRTGRGPKVGALLVRRGHLLAAVGCVRADGFHAEGIAMLQARGATRGATLYTTLEPCNAEDCSIACAERIWRAGIERVVIGCEDPSPYARGGAAYLRGKGVHVCCGPWRARAEALVADRRASFELAQAGRS